MSPIWEQVSSRSYLKVVLYGDLHESITNALPKIHDIPNMTDAFEWVFLGIVSLHNTHVTNVVG